MGHEKIQFVPRKERSVPIMETNQLIWCSLFESHELHNYTTWENIDFISVNSGVSANRSVLIIHILCFLSTLLTFLLHILPV